MNIFPLLWSFGLSFYRYRANRVKEPEFVWFKNYEKVLSDPVVWERFQTTAIIVTIDVLLQLVVGFLLALLFEKTFPGRRVLLMLVLTPMMLSFVAVGAFFRYYYEPTFGLLSQAIKAITGEPFILLGSEAGALAGIIFADVWMWSPFVMLLVLAGLVSVPKHLYEARRSTGRRGGGASGRSPSPTSGACCCSRSSSAPSRRSSSSTSCS